MGCEPILPDIQPVTIDTMLTEYRADIKIKNRAKFRAKIRHVWTLLQVWNLVTKLKLLCWCYFQSPLIFQEKSDHLQPIHFRGGSRMPGRKGRQPSGVGGANIWFCQIFQKIEKILACSGTRIGAHPKSAIAFNQIPHIADDPTFLFRDSLIHVYSQVTAWCQATQYTRALLRMNFSLV